MKTELDILLYRYFLCIAVYVLASDLNQAVGILLSEGVITNYFLRTLVMVVPAYALMFLCGLMAGLQIKKKPILHASIATMIGASIHIKFISGLAAGDYIRVFLMLALGAVFGGVGGLASVATNRMRSKRSKTERNTDHSDI